MAIPPRASPPWTRDASRSLSRSKGPRTSSTSVPHAVDGAFAEHEPAGGSGEEYDPVEAGIADSDPIGGAPAGPWWHRRRWLLIPEAQDRGAEQVLAPDYVLELVSVGADVDEPQDNLGTLDALGLSADELRQYESFNGHRVWSGGSRYGMVCLLVATHALRERNGSEGCSPKGLETVSENVWFEAEGLTRFVLKGDHVEVYVFHRAADPSQG
ncbi:hypothetical protein ACPW96_22490 [Micromonospora sp. DT81.3]|uniref:hypothetical protein n=1 Tax=Micromonospora sp. DT81.3 TaxID=3416523 RepID=UPI003CE817BC